MVTATAVVTSSSIVSTAVLLPRTPSTTNTARCTGLRLLPPRLSFPSFSSSVKSFSDFNSSPLLHTRASSSEDTSAVDTSDLLADLKEKWDGIENKSTVLLYGGGAIVAVWISSTIVGAINSVPLVPKIFELVGLGYTGWFVYRYLLFKSSRKELADDIEDLKRKIAGTE